MCQTREKQCQHSHNRQHLPHKPPNKSKECKIKVQSKPYGGVELDVKPPLFWYRSHAILGRTSFLLQRDRGRVGGMVSFDSALFHEMYFYFFKINAYVKLYMAAINLKTE